MADCKPPLGTFPGVYAELEKGDYHKSTPEELIQAHEAVMKLIEQGVSGVMADDDVVSLIVHVEPDRRTAWRMPLFVLDATDEERGVVAQVDAKERSDLIKAWNQKQRPVKFHFKALFRYGPRRTRVYLIDAEVAELIEEAP